MMRWRLELCHKDRRQLRDLFAILRSKPRLVRNLVGFNVPNKARGLHYLEDTLRWIQAEEEIDASADEADNDHDAAFDGDGSCASVLQHKRDVVLHYSMKYQAPLKKMTKHECVVDFARFCRSCQEGTGTSTGMRKGSSPGMGMAGRKKRVEWKCSGVLLVTGSKPMENDSLSVLESLAEVVATDPERRKRNLRGLEEFHFHCAFNPFLRGAEKKREFERLKRKLKTGLCKGVWLQIGTDIGQLTEGLEYLSKLKSMTPHTEELAVYGGLFLPSKLLLAQQKFRPWNGVKLSDAYLGSVETALDITRDILHVFQSHGVVPLFESKVYKVEQLEDIERLLLLT